jgi:diguanylate cyclase (GGDEF)-like protein/PAS domain S-box-containing protein
MLANRLAASLAGISRKHCAQSTGVVLGTLGLLVILGWWTKTAVLVQVLPGAAAMQFNTAVLFVLMSIALIALARARCRAALGLGAVVALFAAATASQDLLGTELGIDNLLRRDWSGIELMAGGRMAINTAFCFVLTGLSLMSLANRGAWRGQPLLEGVAGSIVGAIGLAASVGYFSGIEAAYGWGGSIGMAFHTGLGFTLCGAALVRLAVDHERVWSSLSPKWLPLSAALLVVTVSLVYWQALHHEQAMKKDHHAVIDATLAMGALRALVFALLIYYFQQSRRQLHLAAQSAAALGDSQRRFRAIFDQTFQFIGLMSTDGTVLEANRTALAFAGLTEADVVNKPFWETAWWTHSRELQRKLRDAIGRASQGEFIRFEATHPDRDGKLHVVDFSLKPVHDERGEVVMLIPEGRDITDQKHAEVELTRLARQDKLTELPNRSLLMDRLQQVVVQANVRHQHDYAFLFLDFDRFKFVNDTLGHRVGDELLKAIARRLQAEVNPVDSLDQVVSGDTTARLGGDEFVVLLQRKRTDEVLDLAQRLLAALSQPYQLAGHEVHSTASIGVVLGNPDYQCAEEVIRDADAAMYAAKRAGKARYVVFDAEMREAFRRRLQLENDLRGAVERQELTLAYQPILSLATGEIQSVEVLPRWRHPTMGDVGPAEFIPIAEESDLIHSLGDWMLASACRQMFQWRHDLGASAPAIISLNLSYKQFRHPELLAKIQAELAESGLQSKHLQLELGERAFAHDERAANATAEAIRELGIQLAIDDFGTGSASLASVHRFPVDAIKVNRSMLADLETSKDSAALIHALAVLVKNLGVCMVADGVETFAQAVALQELGCGYAQGHFLARPLSAEEFEEFAPRHSGITCEAQGAMSFSHRWSDTMVLHS